MIDATRIAAYYDAQAARYDATMDSEPRNARFRDAFRTLVAERIPRGGRILDFGCGTGATTSLLREILGAETIVGVDRSLRSLEVARQSYGSERVRFFPVDEYRSVQGVDLGYSNGVFHHIPREQRGEALRFISRALRPGGLFAFWENNPWNPGTRQVMARCVFDQDAVTLTPIEARRLLRSEGYTVLRTDFLFIFPRSLKVFRPAEKLVHRMPLGAQYQVLCQKPISQ